MKILQLFLKPKSGEAVVARSHLTLLKGQGIQGDIHARVGSPRQVLLVESASLNRFKLNPGDLQENILVDESLENVNSGQVLQVGEALLRITFPCEPCAYLETLQKGLTKRIKHDRGLLAMVIKSGTISLGDTVSLLPYQFPALSNTAKDRFYELIARVPVGKVITTSDIILALGVTNAHYRVIPSFMKQADASIPIHRIVSVDGRLFTKYCAAQREQLLREGVEIENDNVLERDRWHPEDFHPCKLPDG